MTTRSPGSSSLPPGSLAGARDLTADHIRQRTQFGRALAEFQAVAMQIADVYIASRTLDLAADNAVWRVASGLDVRDDLAVAAYWTCAEAPARDPYLPPPARRHGRRRDLSAAPPLLVADRHHARPRRTGRHAAARRRSSRPRPRTSS